MKTLYIFATSHRPDVYINAIAYSIEHLNVGSIHVIVVSEHSYLEEEQKAKLMATKVVANINHQLEALHNKKYLDFRKESGNPKSLELNNVDGISIYAKCLEVINKSGTTGIVIPYSKLDTKLREYIKKGNCTFDLSALKKNLLVDIVAIVISYSFSDVYTFELRKKPTFDQNDLYHNLRYDESFIFRNLADSHLVRNSLRRISRWSVKTRTILILTVIISLVFISLSIFWKNSPLLTIFNNLAIIASLGSYLYLFIKDKF